MNKTENFFSARLLQSLTVPKQPWLDTSIDFIDSLLASNRMSIIFTMIDRVTKFSHFFHWLIHTQLHRQLKHSSMVFLNTMDCQRQQFLIMTQSSPVHLGNNCFKSKAQLWPSAQPTTHNKMTNLRLLSQVLHWCST